MTPYIHRCKCELMWTNLNQKSIFADHVRRTREGNVFTHVCDSVHADGEGEGGVGMGREGSHVLFRG